MRETVLVTGAAGFIGSHLVEALLSSGRSVVGIDNLDSFYDPAIKLQNVSGALERDEFSFVRADVRDRDTIGDVFRRRRPDTVVHLAARAGVRPSIENPSLYADVNVTGSAVVLSEAAEAGVERFVLASSSSVYGERDDPPFRETDSVDRPVSPYAATKKAAELLAHAVHHVSGMAVSCLRYFTVFGPRQRPEMAIHRFARLIEAGEPVPLYGGGESARDYTYVADVVDGTIRALERAKGYRVYNIGGSHTTTLSDLVAHLESALGRGARTVVEDKKPGDVTLTFACIDRAREELGYEPQVSLKDGLVRFVEWLREESS